MRSAPAGTFGYFNYARAGPGESSGPRNWPDLNDRPSAGVGGPTVRRVSETQQLSAALYEARAAASVAFGVLQVALIRELVVRLQAAGSPAGQTMPLQFWADQLEAAVSEL